MKRVNESLSCFVDVGVFVVAFFLHQVASLCDLLFLPQETSVTPFLVFVMHHKPEEKIILSSLGYCTLESNNLMYTGAGVIKVPVEQEDGRYTSVSPNSQQYLLSIQPPAHRDMYVHTNTCTVSNFLGSS